MTASVITITSGKGGVGKTTSTANLGIALAKRGKNVVCLDMDIGLRNLDLVLGLENRILYDVVDVVEGRVRLKQALIKDKRVAGLQVLPAAQKRDKTAVNEKQVIKLCDDLRQEFDFILLDSPAGIEHGYRNSVAPADQVLLVTTPEVAAVRDADRVIGLLNVAGKRPPFLILNRFRRGMVARGDMMDTTDILELLNIDLIGIVPEDESVIAATNMGQPVVLNSHSAAGNAYQRIARRILGENVPLPSIDGSTGLKDRFSKLFRTG